MEGLTVARNEAKVIELNVPSKRSLVFEKEFNFKIMKKAIKILEERISEIDNMKFRYSIIDESAVTTALELVKLGLLGDILKLKAENKK